MRETIREQVSKSRRKRIQRREKRGPMRSRKASWMRWKWMDHSDRQGRISHGMWVREK